MKVITTIIFIIQIVLTIIFSILSYTAYHKMGVVRSITYRNSIYDLLEIDIYLMVGFIILLITFTILYFLGNKLKKAIYILSTVGSIVFLYYNSTNNIFIYYIVGIYLFLILLLEMLKVVIEIDMRG